MDLFWTQSQLPPPPLITLLSLFIWCSSKNKWHVFRSIYRHWWVVRACPSTHGIITTPPETLETPPIPCRPVSPLTPTTFQSAVAGVLSKPQERFATNVQRAWGDSSFDSSRSKLREIFCAFAKCKELSEEDMLSMLRVSATSSQTQSWMCSPL